MDTTSIVDGTVTIDVREGSLYISSKTKSGRKFGLVITRDAIFSTDNHLENVIRGLLLRVSIEA